MTQLAIIDWASLIDALPPVVFDGLSFLLVLALVVAVVVGIISIIGALVDVAVYALLTAFSVALLLLLSNHIGFDGAIRVMEGFLDFVFVMGAPV